MSNVTENRTLSMRGGNDEFISCSQLRIISFILVILLIILCILGIIGNIFSFSVLFHHRMRNPTNYILAALSLSDILFLIHSLLFSVINIYSKDHPVDASTFRAQVYPYLGAYGSVVTARITSLLTLLLCIERFIAVYFPMHAKQICNVRNTWIGIIGIYIVTAISFIPLMLKYKTEEIFIPMKNVSTVKLDTTDFYKNNVNFFKIYGTSLNILFRFAPLCILPFLNALIIRTVQRAWKMRRKMSENGTERARPSLTLSDTTDPQSGLRQVKVKVKERSTDDTRTTVMLLTVSFVFLICILPGAINSIATHIWPQYSRLGEAQNLYMCISSVAYLLQTLNSSVNFIIYMLMSKRFRVLYKHMFCCGSKAEYGNLSISSVKEKFRWSSRRLTNGGKDQRNGQRLSDNETMTNGGYKSVPVATRKINVLPNLANMHRSRSECFQNNRAEHIQLPRRQTTSRFPIG